MSRHARVFSHPTASRGARHRKKGLDPGTRSRGQNGGVATDARTGSLLRSGELARLAGVSGDTLRHYERRGLLPRPPRSSGGYRLYSNEAARRVRLIRGALAIGFSIQELGGILTARDRGAVPCKHVRDLAASKLQNLERQIAGLSALRSLLSRTLREWDKRLKRAGRGKRAGLLESFVAAHPESAGQPSPLLPPGLHRRPAKEKHK